METESLLTSTKKLLRSYDLRARKGLAQHFLVDGSILKRIVSAAELSQSDTVIEVGPGLGVLTKGLAERAGRIIAIELDKRLADILRENMAVRGNLTVINEDILATDPAQLLPPGGYKVVANLPYYITSAVIRHFLEASYKPTVMVLMVQKEVANTIVAKPGDMSVLSVSVQLYGEPKVAALVPASSFYPAPKIDSAVLKIDVYPRPLVAAHNTVGFFRIVRAGFTGKRKQIINSLTNGLRFEKTEVSLLLEAAGIDPKRRAETLSIEEWGTLFHVFESRGKFIAND
jgi:16S rRNA (adenine1518-N6/adenine1519-N6)-dimethyltransferase